MRSLNCDWHLGRLLPQKGAAVPPNLSLLATALALVIALLPSACAQDQEAATLLRTWDADHDGTLSLDEVRSAASAEFDKLDVTMRARSARRS